jgi:hypothetical protein
VAIFFNLMRLSGRLIYVALKIGDNFMKAPGTHLISKQVISYEVIAIASIIALIWLDEIIDIPHLLLGAESTPLNWRESLFESIIIALLGTVIINFTTKLFRKMKYLEGILPVCASCKKIRDDKGNWHQIESFIRDRSEAEFSHSICPECAKKLYPELELHKKE